MGHLAPLLLLLLASHNHPPLGNRHLQRVLRPPMPIGKCWLPACKEHWFDPPALVTRPPCSFSTRASTASNRRPLPTASRLPMCSNASISCAHSRYHLLLAVVAIPTPVIQPAPVW